MARKTTKTNGEINVLELRKTIGKLIGQKIASRTVLAKLVGASSGSVVNWEKGMAPRPQYMKRLLEIEKKADAGTLNVEAPKRGGARKKARTAKPAAPRARHDRQSIARALLDLSLEVPDAKPLIEAARVLLDGK